MKIKEVIQRENDIATKWHDEMVSAMKSAIKKDGFEGQSVREKTKKNVKKIVEKHLMNLLKIGEQWVTENLQ